MTNAREYLSVYTDGACAGNPGPGGWAWAQPDGAFASGAEAHSTNQRMEITAAFRAVEALAAEPGAIEVVSDSTYVVNCFRDRWHEGWRKRGWVNTARKPVANRDLWEPFIDLVLARGNVTFRWVKGHGGDPMNDLVDRLAVEACATQAPRSGRTADLRSGAEPLGAPDAPAKARRAAGGAGAGVQGSAANSSAASADEPVGAPRVGVPEGHLLVVGGHRPPELGGYDENPVAADVRRRVGEILQAKAQMHPDLAVVSGLQLGAETLGAEAALAAGIPLVVVLAFPEPDKVWPKASRERFARLCEAAREVITLERKAPDSKAKVGGSLARREAWLARAAEEAVLVWDGQDSLIGRQVRSYTDHLGEEQVWIVAPTV